jgi:hypothetical protein
VATSQLSIGWFRLRMNEARRLLRETKKSVVEVALAVGYAVHPIETWVTYMADQLWNLSPIINVVDETRDVPGLNRRSQPAILTAKFPTGVNYAGLQSKSDEDFRRV